MQALVSSLLLLLAAAAMASGMKVDYWGTGAERAAIINEALSEAKLSATLREQAVQDSMDGSKPISAFMKLNLGFRKASPRVQEIGKARLFMEDAVKRAERKLFELKKTTDPLSMSSEARAEEIAAELFHRPGRYLKEEEIAKIYKTSGCREERSENQIDCDLPSRISYRTIDGICNNNGNITLGASMTALRRFIPPQYEDGISSPRGTIQFLSDPGEEDKFSQLMRVGPFQPPRPSPRLVSLQIVRDRPFNELPVSHMVMQWGQFLDHDMDLSPALPAQCMGCELTEICHPIRVPSNDNQFGVGTLRNGDCLPFSRTVPICKAERPGSFQPRNPINALTSFIDASMVYGSDVAMGNALREFQGGLLRSGPPLSTGVKRNLPTISLLEDAGIENARTLAGCLGGADCVVCGDVRCNEQVGLTVLHTVWLREHNRLARELQQLNPQWSDERLFQEARAIVGALIQKITYYEFLPIILGEDVFGLVIGEFNGYNREVDPSIPNSFATAAYRFGHSQIRPDLSRLDANYQPLSIGPISLGNAFFNVDAFLESLGTDPILRGLVSDNARRLDELLTSTLTNQLFETPAIPGSGLDLASLNIQRSRDHGLPSYTTFQRFCRFVFPEMELPDIENQLTFVRLLQVYGSLENAELWVGGLAEERLNGSLVGPTFACLLGLTFRNLRDGDRFYFESSTSHFKDEQLAEIRRTTLSSVLCSSSEDIGTVQKNAFLTNEPRVSCQQIPAINLDPWREEPCYARIDPANINGLVYAFSSASSPVVFKTFTNRDNPNCLEFVCPTKGISSILAVYFSRGSGGCSTVGNSGLPQSPRRVFYFGTIEGSHFTPANGLHSSLQSCLNSNINAFTFEGCAATSSFAQEDTTTNCSLEAPDCPSSLPEDLSDLLKEKSAASLGVKNTAKEKEQQVENNFVQQQQLLHELENDLKQLNQQ